MDAREHARFLQYLERFDYFKRPGLVKLDRESFVALDRELTQLLRSDRHHPKVKKLRHVLMRD